MVNKHVVVIGDVHGKIKEYEKIAEEANYSIQVGDLSIKRANLSLNSYFHKVVGGNHDRYAKNPDGSFDQPPHYLGDFGTIENSNIYFVRGGLSVDKNKRIEGVDWWPEEQLSYQRMKEALQNYWDKKPDFVVSHECPASVSYHVAELTNEEISRYYNVSVPSATAKLLDAMLCIHEPKYWVFGHYHKTNIFKVERRKTVFICLGELEYAVFDSKLNLTGINSE